MGSVSTASTQWQAVPLDKGSFQQGAAGQDHVHGRFHGPGHSKAWGVFDTEDYAGACWRVLYHTTTAIGGMVALDGNADAAWQLSLHRQRRETNNAIATVNFLAVSPET